MSSFRMMNIISNIEKFPQINLLPFWDPLSDHIKREHVPKYHKLKWIQNPNPVSTNVENVLCNMYWCQKKFIWHPLACKNKHIVFKTKKECFKHFCDRDKLFQILGWQRMSRDPANKFHHGSILLIRRYLVDGVMSVFHTYFLTVTSIVWTIE